MSFPASARARLWRGADFAMGIVADCFVDPMFRGGLGHHFDPDFGIGIGRVGRKFDLCGFAACKGCIGGGGVSNANDNFTL